MSETAKAGQNRTVVVGEAERCALGVDVVGLVEGWTNGDEEGALVGAFDGAAVAGASDGLPGSGVGWTEGRVLGPNEGEIDGRALGISVVRIVDGCAVRDKEGLTEGFCVGVTVGTDRGKFVALENTVGCADGEGFALLGGAVVDCTVAAPSSWTVPLHALVE